MTRLRKLSLVAMFLAFNAASHGEALKSNPESEKLPGVAKLVGRNNCVHSYSVSWEDSYFFQGDTASLNSFLAEYGKLTNISTQVMLHPGKEKAWTYQFPKKFENSHASGKLAPRLWEHKHSTTIPVDWRFTIAMCTGDQSHLAPSNRISATTRVEVWLGGQISLKSLKVPAGLSIDFAERTNEETKHFVMQHRRSQRLKFAESNQVTLSMGSMKYLLDFETGQTMDPPQTSRPKLGNMDIRPDHMQPYELPTGLRLEGEFLWQRQDGVRTKGKKVAEKDWDTPASNVRSILERDDLPALDELEYDPNKPATYFFTTREGTHVVLQILGLDEEHKGIRFRYKTLVPVASSGRAINGAG